MSSEAQMAKKAKATIVVYAAVMLILIVAAMVVIMMRNRNSELDDIYPHTPVTDAGEAFDYGEDYLAVAFDNIYQIQLSVPPVLVDKVLDSIARMARKQDERDTAPHENSPVGLSERFYIATIDEVSFRLERSYTPVTHSFNMSMSDGRIYRVLLFTNEITRIIDTLDVSRYLAVAMTRIDDYSDASYAFLYYRNSGYLSVLDEWLRDVSVDVSVVVSETF